MSKLPIVKILFPGFLCFLLVLPVTSQNGPYELMNGKIVSRVIKAGEAHQYTVRLEADQFAFFNLLQQGIDVFITIYGPDGKKMEEFDSPNGANGPEFISIISGKKGSYVLEVCPLEANVPTGSYQINLVRTEPRAVTPEKQTDQLFAAWDKQDSPGASIAVVREGRILYAKGYGSANLEYDIPNSPATVFHIASVSKQFTAFAILLLERDGLLSLDDDIRKYVKEVPDFGKTITLRHLVHHTSGLRDQWNLLAMAGWRLDDVITREHVLKLVANQKALNFEPGSAYLYCNTGFTLLAEVVSRVSGQSFSEFTQERIFEPLHMTHTFFYDDHEKIVKNRAYSYYADGTGYKKSVLSYATVGATSLFTTVEDLSLWAMNFENPVVGDRKIMERMNEKGILNNGDTISYALGQEIDYYKGLTLINHGGADAGYRTFLGRFPDQRFSVIVLSNEASFNPAGMALKIADIYLKGSLKEISIREATEKEAGNSPSVLADVEMLKSYCGQYELQPGVIVTVSQDQSRLYAEAPGLSKILLNQVNSNEFTLKGADTRVQFLKNNGGVVDRMKVFMNGQEALAPRISPFDPGSIDLTDFTGDFYSPELRTTYTFSIKGDKLVASHPRVSDFVLNPVRPDQFISDLWFFGQIEFVRDGSNVIKGCRVSSGRVMNLWFGKMP